MREADGALAADAPAHPQLAPSGAAVPIDLDRVDRLIEEMVSPTVPLRLVPGSDRRTRKRLETKHAILRAAWRLFMTNGYEQTTVQDITAAAAVGKGTFFSHFENKRDVPLQLCQHRRDITVTLYAQGAFGEGSATDRIVRLMATFASLNSQTEPEARIMNDIVLRRFFEDPVIMEPRAPKIEMVLAELLQDGVREGEFLENVDPEHIAQLLYAAFYSTKAAWLRTGPYVVPFDLVERVEASTRTILRGVAASRGGTSAVEERSG